MVSQVLQLGEFQGIQIPEQVLRQASINLNDEVEINVLNNTIIITPIPKKGLDWYLEGYDDKTDRYDWGDLDEPKGRELL